MLLFVNPRISKETRDESWKEEQEEKFGRRRSKAVLKRIFEDIFVACNRRGISFGVLTPDIILLLPRSNEVERAKRQCGCRRGCEARSDARHAGGSQDRCSYACDCARMNRAFVSCERQPVRYTNNGSLRFLT